MVDKLVDGLLEGGVKPAKSVRGRRRGESILIPRAKAETNIILEWLGSVVIALVAGGGVAGCWRVGEHGKGRSSVVRT